MTPTGPKVSKFITFQQKPAPSLIWEPRTLGGGRSLPEGEKLKNGSAGVNLCSEESRDVYRKRGIPQERNKGPQSSPGFGASQTIFLVTTGERLKNDLKKSPLREGRKPFGV